MVIGDKSIQIKAKHTKSRIVMPLWIVIWIITFVSSYDTTFRVDISKI